MAKEKIKKTPTEDLTPAEKFAVIRNSIEKKYGEGTALKASEVRNKKKFLVPVSPSLDIGLCGGVPSGSWVLISGPEKAGKSCLALQIAKNAQDLFNCNTLFLNIESRFKRQSTTSIEGLDLDKILVIETTADKLMYGEDFLEIAEDVIKTTYNTVFIFDSLSRMYTRAGGDKEVSGTKRPTAPKLISDFCSRMGGLIAARNHIVICIAQTYANISGYGAATSISVPSAVKYQADIIMNIKKANEWKAKVDGEETQIGNIIDWDIQQNAIGQPPYGLVQSYLRFGYGAGKTEELFNLAVECLLVEKSGTWYTFSNGEKRQGEENSCQYLRDNPEVFRELQDQVKLYTQDTEVLKDFMTPEEMKAQA